MDHARVVRRLKPRAELRDDRKRFRRRHSTGAAHSLVERFAFQQLHTDDQDLAICSRRGVARGMAEHIERSADVRMSHLAGKLNFAAEAFDVARVLVLFESGGLDCDPLVKLLVFRLVHLAHAAAGDESNDLEAARQDLARAKHSVRGRLEQRDTSGRRGAIAGRVHVRQRQVVVGFVIRRLGLRILCHTHN